MSVFADWIRADQDILKSRWKRVVPLKDTRPWWDFRSHVHHHEMTFPEPNLDWVFVCECGHTTTNIEEAQP